MLKLKNIPFNYVKGALFLVLSSFVSVVNDVCMKADSEALIDTLFWRFAFASLVLLPFVLFYRPKVSFASTRNHGIRAILFGVSMLFFTTALRQLPLSLVNAVNFSIPIWVVILACVFLKEAWNGRLLSTFIGIFGVYVALLPVLQGGNLLYGIMLVLGAIGFATLDVFNKHLLNKEESMIMMLFGSSLGIMLLYLPFISFKLPQNLWIYLWLGIGANLILYFILKAWESCDISAIQPIKYLEFPIALYFGNLIFGESLNLFVIAGLAILLVGIFINVRMEAKRYTK